MYGSNYYGQAYYGQGPATARNFLIQLIHATSRFISGFHRSTRREY